MALLISQKKKTSSHTLMIHRVSITTSMVQSWRLVSHLIPITPSQHVFKNWNQKKISNIALGQGLKSNWQSNFEPAKTRSNHKKLWVRWCDGQWWFIFSFDGIQFTLWQADYCNNNLINGFCFFFHRCCNIWHGFW